eukprot:7471217-Pyramimonas_sp.AAC.1
MKKRICRTKRCPNLATQNAYGGFAEPSDAHQCEASGSSCFGYERCKNYPQLRASTLTISLPRGSTGLATATHTAYKTPCIA